MQTIPASRFPQLDPSRIASISGALLVNGVLVLLLIAPMAAPVIVPKEIFTPADPVPQHIPKPPDPPKPAPIQKEAKPTPQPVQQPQQQKERVQPEQPDPVDNAGPVDYAVDPPTDQGKPGDTVTPPDDGKPLAGAHLEYASAPAPTYPRADMMSGNVGTVLLEVLVGVDGRPVEVRIAHSSGYRTLDLAAKRQVLANWTFKPAMRNGQAVQAIGLVPVEFKLN